MIPPSETFAGIALSGSSLDGFIPEDFSPGDRCKLDFKAGLDPTIKCGLLLHRILSPEDPGFQQAYDLLWEQFGAAHEMEEQCVIEQRLRHRSEGKQNPEEHKAWEYPAAVCQQDQTFYEMDLVLAAPAGPSGPAGPAAVRDHTVILPRQTETPGPFSAVVHLSHNLVLPEWRRSGLAAWMRALPVRAARECLGWQRLATEQPIALVAEMEPLLEPMDPKQPARMVRLRAYESAGFRKVAPWRMIFYQPDFRPRAEIAADGVRPIPLHLIVRVCGREDATSLTGAEVRALCDALYGMYERELPQDEVAVARSAVPVVAPDEKIPLILPTE